MLLLAVRATVEANRYFQLDSTLMVSVYKYIYLLHW